LKDATGFQVQIKSTSAPTKGSGAKQNEQPFEPVDETTKGDADYPRLIKRQGARRTKEYEPCDRGQKRREISVRGRVHGLKGKKKESGIGKTKENHLSQFATTKGRRKPFSKRPRQKTIVTTKERGAGEIREEPS